MSRKETVFDGTIRHTRREGYDVYAGAGGEDYWGIVSLYSRNRPARESLMAHFPRRHRFAIRDGERVLELTALAYTNPKRLVFRVDAGRRSYILKWASAGTLGLKRLFPGAMGLTFYTRLMRRIGRAAADGCRSAQEIHLVAEKWTAPFRLEILLLLEYVDGHCLGEEADPWSDHREKLDRAARDLLRHDLTLSDLSPFNFIVTADGIKAIDLSCRPPTIINAVKMALGMNRRYGLDLPVTGIIRKLIRACLSGLHALRRKNTPAR